MAESPAPVITLDGPSGSGKGTISRRVAQALGWHFLDSGALYRLVALAGQHHRIAVCNEAGLATLARSMDIRFAAQGEEEARIFLDNEEVSHALRSQACGNDASQIATLPAVRAALLERQRAFRRMPGLIADGRDMGSVVFPDAWLKIFLTADLESRAQRRYKQLKEKGMNVIISNLIDEIGERDDRDRDRALAPLKPAAGAVVIDSSHLTIEEVVQKVLRRWREASTKAHASS
jgi:cytidylate kinase